MSAAIESLKLKQGIVSRRLSPHKPDFELIGSQITVHDKDYSRLSHFITEEANYYNALNQGLSDFLKTNRNFFMKYDESWDMIFCYVAETGINLKQVYKTIDTIEFPEILNFYRDVFSEELNQTTLKLTGIAATKASIMPSVRRNMALVFYTYYRDLGLHEPLIKNHNNVLQLPRQALTIYWNPKTNVTELLCPYIAHPLILNDVNLLENLNWNHVFLYNKPYSREWLIDITTIRLSYNILLS